VSQHQARKTSGARSGRCGFSRTTWPDPSGWRALLELATPPPWKASSSSHLRGDRQRNTPRASRPSATRSPRCAARCAPVTTSVAGVDREAHLEDERQQCVTVGNRCLVLRARPDREDETSDRSPCRRSATRGPGVPTNPRPAPVLQATALPGRAPHCGTGRSISARMDSARSAPAVDRPNRRSRTGRRARERSSNVLSAPSSLTTCSCIRATFLRQPLRGLVDREDTRYGLRERAVEHGLERDELQAASSAAIAPAIGIDPCGRVRSGSRNSCGP